MKPLGSVSGFIIIVLELIDSEEGTRKPIGLLNGCVFIAAA